MEYCKNLIGRKHEQDILQLCYDSPKAEFVAVYGRRRIGKTYLVKQFFNEHYDFYATGIYEAPRSEQLQNWQDQLLQYSGVKRSRPSNWKEAFNQLKEYLISLEGKGRIVIFIDELPWLDTPKSGFLRALDLFWNGWASTRSEIMLVVCGSATTWMTNKLIGDKGGLHNRVTRPLHLVPFTLHETEEYLHMLNIDWSHQEILDTYMVLGGIPFYLSLLRPNLSLRENIDEAFYGKDAVLTAEYSFLFRSLFKNASLYGRIVNLLATKLSGMTRQNILEQLKITDSGNLSEALENLVKCDFIRKYQAFGKDRHDLLYQLTDMYTLFYQRFVKNNHSMDEHAWSNMSDGKKNAWAGYAFEQVCILHLNQIKHALGISGIASDVCSWTYKGQEGGGQIDLVIDRSDKNIELCEMKYSSSEYELEKKYIDLLLERRELFRTVTKTTKSLRLTFITSARVKHGKYSSMIQGEVTLQDLFKE